MIVKCQVKVLSNKVVCDNNIVDTKREDKEKDNEMVKNKKKLNHLVDIGMNLKDYHPTIVRTMIDGGRDFKIPMTLRNQLVLFANEAHQKGFNPSLFGYNTTLHKIIKSVHNIPKRKYTKGKGVVKPLMKEVDEASSSSSSSESCESETDIDGVLSEVEEDLKNERIGEVKKKLKKYKHKIPPAYYNTIMKSIK
jgi:hypothetical protein